MVFDRVFKALVTRPDFGWQGLSWVDYYPNPALFGAVAITQSLAVAVTGAVLVAVIAFMVYAYLHRYEGVFLGSAAIVLGGASNFWDRLLYQHVIDYFRIGDISAFNLADLLILTGVAWFAIIIIRGTAFARPN